MRKTITKKFLPVCIGYLLAGSIEANDFTVQNLDDSGPGSLRASIASANASSGPHTIDFADGLNGTITLASELPALVEDVEIQGPGSAQIALSGDLAQRLLYISSGITVTISGLSLVDGRAEFGGAISNEGNLTVRDSELRANWGEFSGGAIDNFGGNVSIERSLLADNTTGEFGFGGAISNDSGGVISVTDSTLRGNAADFSGGAIDNIGTLTIVRSTLSGNSAEFGGAIENAGVLNITNSTLSANSAGSAGGGIDNFDGTVSLVFSSLVGNSAASGGGITNNDGASLTAKNSLIVSSVNGDNCDIEAGSSVNSPGTNFSTDASCPGFSTVSGGSLNLGPLADNGGLTPTHALLSGSTAIDAAPDCTLPDNTTAVVEDQRGISRPQGAVCDSGSFESSQGSNPDLIFADGFEGG
jgi:hypothetical protein